MSDNPPSPSPVFSDPQGLKSGEIFWNNYRISGLIGKGGVSSVYKAEHLQTKQLVAIKLLHAHKTKDEELVRRFVRECQTTSKLDHQHAIHIYEWGIDQFERPFMVMEYLQGETLGKRVQRSQGLHYVKAVEIMEQVASAIAEAHSMGIVHRDLKPDNIMLTTHNGLEDWVKVVDFGIAKMELSGDLENVQVNLTRTGAILGTPLYMSPEQLRGRKADARSDIYALGVIMYELLTGKPPFISKNTAEVVVGHLNVIADPPSKVRMDLNIPTSLDEPVMRALAKNPWERPTTVAEFCNSLLKGIEKPTGKNPAGHHSAPQAVSQRPPTPAGMIADPVLKVCSNCKAVARGGNYKYCLKCGIDNTNIWLPYHKKMQHRSMFDLKYVLSSSNRRLISLVVLGIVLCWAAYAYLSRPIELTGRFETVLERPLFSNQKLPPALAKQLQVSNLQVLLTQKGDAISGLLNSNFGQQAVTGKITEISPMIISYEINSSIKRPEGILDLEMAGTYDKVLGQPEWALKVLFRSNKSKPVSDLVHMKLRQID
jgi:serine/threonine protein kinase